MASGVREFLKNSNVVVVQDRPRPRHNSTHSNMDPFDSPPRPTTRPTARPPVASCPTTRPRACVSLSAPPVKRIGILLSPTTRKIASEPRKRRSPATPRVVANTSSLAIDKVNVTLVNASTKKDEDPAMIKPVSLAYAFRKKLRGVEPVVSTKDYWLDVMEIQGYTSKWESVAVRDEKGLRGSPGKSDFIQIKVEVRHRDDINTMVVYVYKNGTVRVTGGCPGNDLSIVRDVHKYVVKHHTKKEAVLKRPMKWNTINAQLKINGQFNHKRIKQFVDNRRGMSATMKKNVLAITYKGRNFQLSNTSLQMFDVKSPTQLRETVTIARKFIKALDMHGLVQITGSFDYPSKMFSEPVIRRALVAGYGNKWVNGPFKKYVRKDLAADIKEVRRRLAKAKKATYKTLKFYVAEMVKTHKENRERRYMREIIKNEIHK
jgi:hypothetical protein